MVKWLVFILIVVPVLVAMAESGHIDQDIDRIYQRIDKNAELILQMELEIAETKGVLKFLSWTLMAIGTVLVPVVVMVLTPMWEKRKGKDD